MKQIAFILSFFILSVNCIYSQDNTQQTEVAKKSRFYQQPEFPGGERMLMQYLSNNITYPQEAIKKNIQGKVYVEFTVEIDGSISEIKIHKGIGAGCDEETIRVIKAMPKWHPAEQKGQKIRAKHALPVQYFLPRKRGN